MVCPEHLFFSSPSEPAARGPLGTAAGNRPADRPEHRLTPRERLDLFVGVFVMGIIINHVSRAFPSTDTEHLSALRE